MRIGRLLTVLPVVALAVVLTLVAGADEGKANRASYKTVFVPAVAIPAKESGESEVDIDGVRLAKDIEAVLNRLAREGYTVESTVPVISGTYRWSSSEPIKRSQSASASAYAYGFSKTSGVTIVARRD